jgi:hypothetical protein
MSLTYEIFYKAVHLLLLVHVHYIKINCMG